VCIFADSTNLPDEQVQPPVATASYLRAAEDVLIYHHSIGWDSGIKSMRAVPCRRIIKYHNVTPPEFFEGISEQHKTLCQSGRSQVKQIVGCHPDLYLAASAFNESDLIRSGSEHYKTFVVPPFNQADQLRAATANFELLDGHDDGNVTLLTVGGVRPNKGHAALIEAFATYCYDFDRQARMFIVGAEDNAFGLYAARLRQLIEGWSIESRIVFTGEVSTDTLKSYYLIADALLMTSEHEGFCVPLVEAMALKIPIIAYASTAIRETAEDAALIWEERDPFLMAQSIDFLQANEEARMELVDRGSRRYEQNFSNSAIEKQFLNVTAQAGFRF
jgi:glycosyltransferase involved in cell wall biosynthesis